MRRGLRRPRGAKSEFAATMAPPLGTPRGTGRLRPLSMMPSLQIALRIAVDRAERKSSPRRNSRQAADRRTASRLRAEAPAPQVTPNPSAFQSMDRAAGRFHRLQLRVARERIG